MKDTHILLSCVLFSSCIASCVIPIPGTEFVAVDMNGKVVDRTTSRPVSNATVMWHGLPETKTSTDAEGRFKLDSVKDIYFFRVYSPGGYTNVPETRMSSPGVVVTHPNYQRSALSIKDICGVQGPMPKEPITVKVAPK